MEIRVRAQEVLDAQLAITRLGQVKMSGAYGLCVARLQKKFHAEAATIVDQRNSILKKHGSLVEMEAGETALMGNEKYTVSKENREEFQKEVSDLMDSEITVHCDSLPRDLPDAVVCEPAIWSGLLPFLEIEGQ